MKKNIILFILIFLFTIPACESIPYGPEKSPESDEFILLEIKHRVSGKSFGSHQFVFHISGVYLYDFDEKSSKLQLYCSETQKREAVKENRMIYLLETQIDRSIGGGGFRFFEGLNDFPKEIGFIKWPSSEQFMISIFQQRKNGDLDISFKNKTVYLKSNSEFTLVERWCYSNREILYLISDSITIKHHGGLMRNRISFVP